VAEFALHGDGAMPNVRGEELLLLWRFDRGWASLPWLLSLSGELASTSM
jgi:hypothetical protein